MLVRWARRNSPRRTWRRYGEASTSPASVARYAVRSISWSASPGGGPAAATLMAGRPLAEVVASAGDALGDGATYLHVQAQGAARLFAASLGQRVRTEHLLVALLYQGTIEVQQASAHAGADPAAVRRQALSHLENKAAWRGIADQLGLVPRGTAGCRRTRPAALTAGPLLNARRSRRAGPTPAPESTGEPGSTYARRYRPALRP